jgi:hypothetical protein
MIFLLKLHPLLGSLIAMLLSMVFTCALFIIAHVLFRGKRPNHTRAFAQQMALRIGTLHALIISLVFGALANDYINLEKTLDNEAAAVGSVYMAMKNIQSDDAAQIRHQLALYLKDVIDNEWGKTAESPLSAATGQILFGIINKLENWQSLLPLEQKIKSYSIDKIFKINEMRIERLYGWYREDVPIIFWIVAGAGFILTLLPYLSVELTRFRFLLINCYSAMMGITFYGIILLNNPFLCGLVSPTPHQMVYEQIKALPASNSAHRPSSDNVRSKGNGHVEKAPSEPTKTMD